MDETLTAPARHPLRLTWPLDLIASVAITPEQSSHLKLFLTTFGSAFLGISAFLL